MRLNRRAAVLILNILLCCHFNNDSHILIAEDNKTNSNDILQIKMLSLGANGDCSIIKCGSTEVLVDAGATVKNSDQIVEELNEYCEDGVLEYCIMTHSDTDHIAAFAGDVIDGMIVPGKGVAGWAVTNAIDTLIDFDITKDSRIKVNDVNCLDSLFTTQTYSKYETSRDLLINTGKIFKYFPASEKFDFRFNEDEEKPIENKNRFCLYENGENAVYLNLMYNQYYFRSLGNEDGKSTSARYANPIDKNLLSVCFNIETVNKTTGSEYFLFTGDLSEYNSASSLKDNDEENGIDTSKSYQRIYGETNFIKYNKYFFDKFNEKGVKYFKAAHHGSDTSNSFFLIESIRPEYVGINAVAGYGKNDFPRTEALNNITKYTDYIYITDKAIEDKITTYYGDVLFNYDISKDEMKVDYEEKTQPLSIFESDWFYENRNLTASIININSYDSSLGDCSIVKIGHKEILINAGSKNGNATGRYIDKIKKYCNDGILEYIIISDTTNESFGDIIGNQNNKNGVLHDNYFKEITNLLDHSNNYYKEENKQYKRYKQVISQKKSEGKIKNYISSNNFFGVANNIIDDGQIYLTDNRYYSASLKVLNSQFLNEEYAQIGEKEDFSLGVVFSLNNKTEKVNNTFAYLNLGKNYESDKINQLIEENVARIPELNKKISCIQIPNHGRTMLDTDKFSYFNKIKNYDVKYLLNAPAGLEQQYPSSGLLKKQYLDYMYCTAFHNINASTKNQELCGDTSIFVMMGKNVNKNGNIPGGIRYSARSSVTEKKYIEKAKSMSENNLKEAETLASFVNKHPELFKY